MQMKKRLSALLLMMGILSYCTQTGDVKDRKNTDMYRDLMGMFQEIPTFVAVGANLQVNTRGTFSYNNGMTSSDTASWSTGWTVNTKLPRMSITQALLYAETLSSGGNTEIDMSQLPEIRIYTEDGAALNKPGTTGGWGSGSYPYNLLPYLNQKIIPVLTYYLTDGRHAYTIYPTIYITTTDE